MSDTPDPTARRRPLGAPSVPPADLGAQAQVESAKEAQAAQDAAAREASEAAAAAAQAAQEASQTQPETPPTPAQLGDGGVQLRYVGPSDEYDFGDGVVAYAGGEPVDVPREAADRALTLEHDTFEEIS
jgi:hypothetical protein